MGNGLYNKTNSHNNSFTYKVNPNNLFKLGRTLGKISKLFHHQILAGKHHHSIWHFKVHRLLSNLNCPIIDKYYILSLIHLLHSYNTAYFAYLSLVNFIFDLSSYNDRSTVDLLFSVIYCFHKLILRQWYT